MDDKDVSYLVRTEDKDGTVLHLFTRNDKYGITAEGELIGYLTALIEVNHNAIGPAVTGVWRWNRDDSRDPMHLNLIDTRAEMEDWQDETWAVTSLAGEGDGIEFTVSINLKGQQ